MHILAVIVAINAFVVGAFAVTMPAPQGLLPNAGNVNSYANNCNSLKINAKVR
jgi:hypothetical protein